MRSVVAWVAVLALVCVGAVLAEKDPILFCDSCKGLIDEIEWSMSQGVWMNSLSALCTSCQCGLCAENPYARIDVRNIRLDKPRSAQKEKSQIYIKSEAFFMEVRSTDPLSCSVIISVPVV